MKKILFALMMVCLTTVAVGQTKYNGTYTLVSDEYDFEYGESISVDMLFVPCDNSVFFYVEDLHGKKDTVEHKIRGLYQKDNETVLKLDNGAWLVRYNDYEGVYKYVSYTDYSFYNKFKMLFIIKK